jgi:hypothetical protein
MVPCSCWEEIVECADYHIKLGGLIEALTCFQLFNNPGAANVGPQQFSVAKDPDRIIDNVHKASSIIRRAQPRGFTTLMSHIIEIHNEVFQMPPELRRLWKKVVIVIFDPSETLHNSRSALLSYNALLPSIAMKSLSFLSIPLFLIWAVFIDFAF